MNLKKLFSKKYNFAGYPLAAGLYLIVVSVYALLRYGVSKLSLLNLAVGLIFIWFGYRASHR